MVIVYLGPTSALPAAQAVLEPTWTVLAPEPTPEAVARHLGKAVAILDASMQVRLDQDLLDLAPELRVISTATTGADHIDAAGLAARHIPLLTLHGKTEILHNLTPAAELSWLLLMACARRLRGAIQDVLEGKWVREAFPGIMLKGKTLGLIGCGRIGSWMARYACAFDMQVIGYDPFVDPWPEQVARCDLDTLLSTADFISLHVPLTDQTRGMLGVREFGRVQPGAVFINTSRGALVDEQALRQALIEGRIGAVGIDVLDGEPKIEGHPLLEYARTHDNLIITPHIGGFSPDAVKLVVEYAAQRIVSVLDSSS